MKNYEKKKQDSGMHAYPGFIHSIVYRFRTEIHARGTGDAAQTGNE
jgi:hypothetical protein